mmetsp:Transcript_24330/g.75111  ORF Transcript_24330/g.75111 Transcript_24330/m.75111 type:complete len:86 (+) Transcript_24330:139-396(+)|eukprot:CAMPEP_0198656746 /NCGR_PEP_ID=MMETSP1467-20131203/10843_1 /TAXON_ID=1462469 /ORGANISM="unid. sp., Strain CCMP2135" /LENGTH=85 /DNA_ID=CAMNT_0044392819 /DNA_START=139 /DNA_END=396 /DNA_ORIENTATION=+
MATNVYTAAYINGQMPVQNPNPGIQIANPPPSAANPPPNANANNNPPPNAANANGVNQFTAAYIAGQYPVQNSNPGNDLAWQNVG